MRSGKITQDITTVPLGTGNDGNPVYLRDLWPTNKEIADVIATSLSRDQFLNATARSNKARSCGSRSRSSATARPTAGSTVRLM